MTNVNRVEVELDVLLGQTVMPIKQLLRMGRGAIIELDTRENADVLISSSGTTIALGEICVEEKSDDGARGRGAPGEGDRGRYSVSRRGANAEISPDRPLMAVGAFARASAPRDACPCRGLKRSWRNW